MNERFSTKVLKQLELSVYWTEKTRKKGTTIHGLTCPACGVKGAAWAYTESPMSINCNRLNNCGARTNTVTLFNIRQNIEQEFKPTPTEPHRPAAAYLSSRSLKKAQAGLKFEYWPNVRKTGSGAVMFPVHAPDLHKPVFNGRLITPLKGTGKTHNCGSTTGCFWKHPSIKYKLDEPTYVVEGIIDALSLIEIDVQAIAVLSAGQDPTKVDLSKYKNLTFAFDNDPAGTRAFKKWSTHYPEAQAIAPDKGQDWNDLLCSSPTTTLAKSYFRANLQRFKTNAQLLLAETPQQYASIYRDFHEKAPGLFEFSGFTYFAALKRKGDEKYLIVEKCGNFTFEVVSFFLDTNNPIHSEYRYHLKITPVKSKSLTALAAGRDLSTARNFKEFLLTRAKVVFTGGTAAFNALLTRITTASNAPEVIQATHTGYDLRTGWYIFKHYAVDKEGKTHFPDSNDRYKCNRKQWYTPAPHATEKTIRPTEKGISPQLFTEHLEGAWGSNALVALYWSVASWFVCQIKEKIGFFPMCSIYGPPACGKSALTVTLNACQGISGEGFPVTQLSTKKALARSIARQSGLFSALLEDNQRNDRGAFDYSIMLTAYNQGPLLVRASFSNDNRTEESPFLGALLFVQNTEPFQTAAEKQRVISLSFTPETLNDTTRGHFESLQMVPEGELARILRYTLQNRKLFEENWHKEYIQAIEDLSPQENRRILQNHAIILCFARLFNRAHNIEGDITNHLKRLTEAKCDSSKQRTYDLADHFFEAIDLLNEEKLKDCLYLEPDTNLLNISLSRAENLLKNKGLQFTVTDYLTQALRQHPAFVQSSKKFRFPEDPETDRWGKRKQRRVWVFDANKI